MAGLQADDIITAVDGETVADLGYQEAVSHVRGEANTSVELTIQRGKTELKKTVQRIPTVWYIEFSNHLVADSIAEAAGVKTALFHTCHNVSADELEAGATYVSLMEQNLETLRENL